MPWLSSRASCSAAACLSGEPRLPVNPLRAAFFARRRLQPKRRGGCIGKEPSLALMKALSMTSHARIELRDLHLPAAIGTYGPGDVVPDAHVLDLDLAIAPALVQIAEDTMASVFDYDPLIARIADIAQSRHFATQEYLMTLIIEACAAHPEITALTLCLRKYPVRDGTGSLGVRLSLAAEDMALLRAG
jgi:dihydroneopterin aldolase